MVLGVCVHRSACGRAASINMALGDRRHAHLCPQVCLTRGQHATGRISILTEETSPSSVDERALSLRELCQSTEEMAEQ